MDYAEAVTEIVNTIDKLHQSGVISDKINCNENTVLIGTGAELDSLAFVALIADLEESLTKRLDREIIIDLNGMQNFDLKNPLISTKTIASHVVSLANN